MLLLGRVTSTFRVHLHDLSSLTKCWGETRTVTLVLQQDVVQEKKKLLFNAHLEH